MLKRLRNRLILVAVCVVVGALVALYVFRSPRLTESDVQTLIVDTLIKERPDAFLVTGTLEFATQVEQRSNKVLLPGVLNLSLGTTRVALRAPGRAVYGFDVRALTADDIRLRGDTVEVALPPLRVYAVEPDLERVEIETEVGWARMHGRSGQAQELLAWRSLQPAMRARAESYLETAEPPVENTQRAVEAMLRPVLQVAGLEEPVFVFRVGPLEGDRAPS